MANNTLQIALKGNVNDNSLPFLNEIRMDVSGTTNSNRVVAIINGIYTNGSISILTLKGKVHIYPASSLSDTVIAGKTEITEISSNGYYVFSMEEVNSDSIIFLCKSSLQTLTCFSTNGSLSIGSLGIFFKDVKYYNGLVREFNAFHADPLSLGVYIFDVLDIYNSDMVFIFFNMASFIFLSGDITNNTYYMSTTNKKSNLQITPIGDFSLDFSKYNISNQPAYIMLTKNINYDQSKVSIIVSGTYQSLFFAKSTSLGNDQLHIELPMSAENNDKILLALASNTTINSSCFTQGIVLTGGRTSASDSAVSTLTGKSITVTINS